MIDEVKIGNEFVLRFVLADDQHQIKADTFANSLSEITAVLKEINRIGKSRSDINIYINAPEPGSFQINIQLPEKQGWILELLVLAIEVMPLFLKNGGNLYACAASTEKLKVSKTIVVYEDSMNQKKIEIERNYVEKVLGSKKINDNLSDFFKCAYADAKVEIIELSEKDGDNRLLTQILRKDFLSFQSKKNKTGKSKVSNLDLYAIATYLANPNSMTDIDVELHKDKIDQFIKDYEGLTGLTDSDPIHTDLNLKLSHSTANKFGIELRLHFRDLGNIPWELKKHYIHLSPGTWQKGNKIRINHNKLIYQLFECGFVIGKVQDSNRIQNFMLKRFASNR